jgi:hypothetical protein
MQLRLNELTKSRAGAVTAAPVFLFDVTIPQKPAFALSDSVHLHTPIAPE